MATGETYESVVHNLEKPALIDLALQRGFEPKYDLALLDLLGFEYETFYTEGGYRPTLGRPAILMVESKNIKGKKHAVYYDGEFVIDPSNRDTYQTSDGLAACEWVIEITNAR